MENILNDIITECKERGKEYCTYFESDLTLIRERFSVLMTPEDLLIGKFGPRLLETILFVNYFSKYTQTSKSKLNRLLSRVRAVTLDQNTSPHLDVNLQNILYELSLITEEDEFLEKKISQWLLLYRGLLFELFEDDYKIDQLRKIILFNTIAIYSTNVEMIRDYIYMETIKIIPNIPLNERMNLPVWHKITFNIFRLLYSNINQEETRNLVTELMKYQLDDGSWQKNNLITLILLHTIKFFPQLEKNCHVEEEVSKGEKYLEKYLNQGISVIDHQKIYNTAFFHGSNFYFYGKQISSEMVNYYIRHQNPDGGWSLDEDFPLGSDLDTTVYVLINLIANYIHTKNRVIRESILKGVEFFLSLKIADNGFTLYPYANVSMPEMTSRGIMLACLLPNEFMEVSMKKNLIAKGFDVIYSQQEKNGTFRYNAYSKSEIYPLLQVALAINYYTCSKLNITKIEPKIKEISDRIISYLQTNQKSNGSYSSVPSELLKGEEQSTFYALITLNLLNADKNELSELAIKWTSYSILNKELVDPEGTGPRPIRYIDYTHRVLFAYLSRLTSVYGKNPIGMYQVQTQQDIN